MSHELPNYPKDHQVGMVVPKGGSNCAKCEYVRGQKCTQKDFVRWNGSAKIPAPVSSYCCDFFEARDSSTSDRRSPHGFPSLYSLKREAGIDE